MISSYVMTQRNCEGIDVANDPVGLGAYGMDSHHVKRYVDSKGFVKNEGNVESHVNAPYPLSYRSIIPKEEECSNLLVPVCVSSTHIAFGSIRMEPVFMVLGQSAAMAACLAIDRKISVQKLKYNSITVFSQKYSLYGFFENITRDSSVKCFEKDFLNLTRK